MKVLFVCCLALTFAVLAEGQKTPTCNAMSCSGHGKCEIVNGKQYCFCQHGYTGGRCQTKSGGSNNQCTPKTCNGHGSCHVSGGHAFCFCKPGYSGTRCQTKSGGNNACKVNPCKNGGRCFTIGGKPHCACKPGYYGTDCQNHTMPHKCNTHAVVNCVEKQSNRSMSTCARDQLYAKCAVKYKCKNILTAWCNGFFQPAIRKGCKVAQCAALPKGCNAKMYKTCQAKVESGSYPTLCKAQLAYIRCALNSECKQYQRSHCKVAMYDCPAKSLNQTFCPHKMPPHHPSMPPPPPMPPMAPAMPMENEEDDAGFGAPLELADLEDDSDLLTDDIAERLHLFDDGLEDEE